MKRLLILILLCSCLMGFQFIGGKPPPTGGGSCPSATYMTDYTMDYTDETKTACITNGDSTKDSGEPVGVAVSSSYGESGNGAQLTDSNEYIEFVVTGEDMADKDTGTIWMSVRVQTMTENCSMFEFAYDTSNVFSLVLRTDSKIQFYYEAGGADASKRSTDATLTIGASTWHRIGISWDSTAGTGSLSVQIDAGGWAEDTNEGFGVWAGTPDALAIGENDAASGQNWAGEEIWIDNVRVFSTYQAADPGV